MYHIDHICGYINFLKQTIGLKISIHPMNQNNIIDFGKLIKYNIHESVYCVYVKTSKSAHNKCLECQQKSRVSTDIRDLYWHNIDFFFQQNNLLNNFC